MLPMEFHGAQLELRGFLRTEDLSNFAGLWMREDDDGGGGRVRQYAGPSVERNDRMEGVFSIVLPLNRAAKRLAFGGFTGTVLPDASDM